MTTLTIPKKFAMDDDLIIVPRKQYEELVNRVKNTDWIYEKPIAKELKKRIDLANKEFKSGKLTVWK
jgi:hypothetical protein